MTAPSLENHHCLITGGSRGLGRSLGLAFASAGAKVAFTYLRNDDAAAQTREELGSIGHPPLVFKGDVGDPHHATDVFRSLEERWGRLDVLVNNAAINQILPLALMDDSDWDKVMNTNVKGAFLFSRGALKFMLRQKRGHILNIGSFGAERVVEAPVHYAASKAALRGLTDSLAAEVGRYGVLVNYLAPGLLDQGMGERLPPHRINDYASQSALGRVGRVAEIAQLATWMVSDANTFMTGSKVVADGGL